MKSETSTTSRSLQLGTWITAFHPSHCEVIASAPFDWICIDLEHSPIDRLSLQQGLQIIQSKGRRAFVRVAENSHLALKFPLDAGADGIIVPMVNSAEEARQAVQHAFYPPVGRRGVGLARAHQFGFAFEKHLESSRKLCLIVQIEHVRAVEEIEEILNVDGVSGVFVGPYDLSGSMGIPGQFTHPNMVNAIEKVATHTKAKGKMLGAHVIAADAREVQRYIGIGYDFIAFSLDTIFLGKKIRDELATLGRASI